MPSYAYILASKPYGTLYVGSTGDIARRVWEHRNGEGSVFCKKYKVFILVYFEQFDTTQEAIGCERRWKKWKRDWKIDLVNARNPEWRDWYEELQNWV
ncbi:GIY-YIG nuclease family protein [Hyphobacterium sp.]|jgi:putative endonuclease|uniref:GIY-YIG nuclease family protein n=1 Tax=Hyphobacterium sp. TaxID=2004662 RepID=UPI003BA9E078